MFRRARLSVKPNVRPSVGARGSGAAAPQRGPDAARPPEPAAPAAAPRPAEPAEEAPADFGGAEPPEKAPRSGDEKTDGENDVVEESSKSSSIVSQRRKRISSTSSVVKPNVSVPSEPQPLSAVNSEVPTPSPVPTAEKQPCSDRYRIYKARKLREMLKEELRKEKKQWKNKYATNESQRPPDRSKMTMRDFIYYLPDNNPMTSSLEQEKRTEKSLTTVQSKEQENKNPPDTEDNEDIEEEADDGPLLVPRVKVAEDGSIILDEESLTVEVLRTKGPCVVEENDPIFERGSTTTYSSFRKNYYSKPWSNKETDMFFLAISMVGTDFSMIGQLFPHRARIEIKNKFKREEKTNGWRIDKAFQEKRPFDFDFFAHLLQKVLAEEEKRKQKSVKSQPLKEKKSSKPQKNVKVKKVTSEGVSDDLDESVGNKVSDTEGLQKDAQTIEEQSSASSEQDLEQGASEADLNQNKRRKKNQEESGKQAVKNHSENTTAQPAPPEEEKQNDKCQPLRPEINEDDGNKEQVLFCIQNSEDISFSSEKVEKRTDPILSLSQQDAMSVRGETLESHAANSPPSDVNVEDLCELNVAEGSSTEERTVVVESKTLEADQEENLKPKVRGRLQRPKPNLSRAVGKKPVLTQSKTLEESKSLHPETSVEKSNMEKDEVNTVDISGMENTEVKNADVETVPNSSEKNCPQEDDEPKVFRPARPLRGRLQRPKPNLSKAAERKETPASQDKNGAENVEKSEIQPCVDRNTPKQVEDQSCKNFECENVMSQPEKNDPSQNIQLDDHEAPNECLSNIQEDSTSNVFKQVPVLKTRFQKPKPNIGRGTRKREMFSKEEVAEEILSSEKMTAALREIARLEISPREEVPVEVDTTQEINSSLKESERRDISPKEKIAETVDTTEEMETDLKETGVEISSSQTVAEVTEVIEEEELGFKETEVEISPSESVPEVTEITEEKESHLKETGVEISQREMIPEMTDVIEEKESDLKEIVEEITPCQSIGEVIEISEEKETDLKKTEEEITPYQRIAEMIETTDKKESDLKETGEEIILCQRIAEVIGITEEKETDLKETGEETTPCQRIAEMIEITEEKESDLKETGEEITPYQRIEMIGITEEKESDLKETGEMITPYQTIEMIEITEENESDLEETEDEIIPYQSISEMIEFSEERETDMKEIEEITPFQIAEMIEITEERETDIKETEEITPCQRIAEEIEIAEETETNLEETTQKEIPQNERVLNEVNTFGEVETDLRATGKEISLTEKAPVGISAIEEREVFMKETGKGDMSLLEKIPGNGTGSGERKADFKESQEDIFLMKSRSEEIGAAEEMVADLKTMRPVDVSLRENRTEETGTLRQTETDLTQDKCGDYSASPSLNASNISSELLPMVQTSVEVKTSSEMEMSSSVHSLQILDCDIIEDQGTQPTDTQEQFSDVNISTSLPEEQKPAEVKPAPFVRSRFKRPKPNLARAALKRETLAAKTPVLGKKLEPAKMEGAVLAQNTVLSDQQDVSPLTTSGEKDESYPREGAAGALPCVQSEQDPLPTSSGDSKEEAESTPAREEDVAISLGTLSTSNLQQERKESTTQSAVPVRGRLQRPRPNVRKAGQRQVASGVEARDGTLQDQRATLQKEEAEKKLLDAANSQLGIEIEVVSSKISECRMNDILDEQKSHEHKATVPSPAPLVRRQFQKAKPNLGRAHGKREERCLGKDRAGQSQAKEPEENWLQQGKSDTQLLEKDKCELKTSHEISARKDCIVGSAEPGLMKKGAQSEVRPSASIGEKSIGDNSMSSVIKEQHLSKPPSCPQLLKEPSYSKTALDRRTASSSISEHETDHSERRTHRKIKSNAARGRGSKRVRSKAPKKEPRTSKAMLVTLRASQEEEDDDDDLDLDYEEESYHLAPEEVNKAPVFVPIGLRSPEPVAAQIEETMEELEITMDVPDVGCITVVEPELLNVEVNPQEVKQDVSENMLTVEITTSEHTQNEAGPSEGNTEAAVALLTVGDVLLQSEISMEQGQVGICVLPDVQSRDKNHIPFSPDHVNHSIVHECQDLSSPVTTNSLPSLKENKIVLDGQSTTEKIELMEEAKEEILSNSNTASEVTNNLKMRRRFAKPKVNLKKILGTSSVGAHSNLSGTKGEEEEIHRETEKSASDAAELEENLGAVAATENWEQSKLVDASGVQGPPEHEDLTERNEDQEAEHQQAQILSVAPVVSADPSSSPHTLGSSEALDESPMETPLAPGSEGCNVLTLHVPECVSTSIPEIQEENVIGSQDLTVNVIAADGQQDNEDEHTFILTLVEIPANEVEEFADTTAQVMPNPLLPAPILLKSVNNEETGDMSMNFPVTSISQDAMCLSDSGRESEKPPANLDVSRKRFHCSLDESDSVPPAKKSSFDSVDDCEKCSSEVCSKELVNVFEETGVSHKEQNDVPTSGSIPTTPKSQKRQLEPSTPQSIGSRSLDKIIDRHLEKTPPLLPKDKMVVSDKEERTCSASKSEQMHNRPSSSKTSLSRPGRRPLGFLSLICSKSSLESDEPTQFHKKKRPKPLIPASRQNLKRSNSSSERQKTNTESSDVLPSSSGVSPASENLSSSAAASQVSCDHPLLEEKCKSGSNQAPGEEPTTVSEYFFGDIFIEVDETQ